MKPRNVKRFSTTTRFPHVLVWSCILVMLTLNLTSATIAVSVVSVDQMWSEMNTNPNLFLIDDRTKESYYEKHLPGAINMIYSGSLTQEELAKLPENKDTRILIYCDCPNGESAHNFANMLETDYGYRNVAYLDQPISTSWKYTWVRNTYDPGTLPARAGSEGNNNANNNNFTTPATLTDTLLFIVLFGGLVAVTFFAVKKFTKSL